MVPEYPTELTDLPHPPQSVVIRDQTTPAGAGAISMSLDLMEEKRGRYDSGEVRALVGQATGMIDALEGRLEEANRLREHNNRLQAELDHLRGQTDERQLRLWRARVLADAQGKADDLLADAKRRAQGILADATGRGDDIVTAARRRADLAERGPDALPARPRPTGDKVEDVLATARWHGSVRTWLLEREKELHDSLDELEVRTREARDNLGERP